MTDAGGIPIIDLGPAIGGSAADRMAVARRIGEASEGVGFFVVANHGLARLRIEEAFAVSAEFFDLPTEAKLKYAPTDATVPRGYNAFKSRNLGRTLGLDTPPDLREQYFIGPLAADPARFAAWPGADRFYSANIWPDAVPGYRPVFSALYGEMEALAKELMRLFALALGLDEGYFDDKLDRHFSTLPSNNYPDLAEKAAAEQRRAGPHTDFGSLTLLAMDDAPGSLQVDVPGAGWTDVRPPPECLVVNLGDMMARWTGERWRSTLHRVANPPVGRGARRQSLAFFLHPNYDAEIACLPTCRAPGAAVEPPILAGEHMRRKLERRVVA